MERDDELEVELLRQVDKVLDVLARLRVEADVLVVLKDRMRQVRGDLVEAWII